MMLIDVKAKICNYYQIKEVEKTRLWMKVLLIDGEMLQTRVEDNQEMKEGSKFFIEQQLQN